MVTGEQVKEAVQKAGLSWVPSHDCSICGQDVGYIFDGDQVFYRSGCGCSWSPDRPMTWDGVASHINMQTRTSEKWGDVRARVAAKFGLTLYPEPTAAPTP